MLTYDSLDHLEKVVFDNYMKPGLTDSGLQDALLINFQMAVDAENSAQMRLWLAKKLGQVIRDCVHGKWDEDDPVILGAEVRRLGLEGKGMSGK